MATSISIPQHGATEREFDAMEADRLSEVAGQGKGQVSKDGGEDEAADKDSAANQRSGAQPYEGITDQHRGDR